MVGEIHHSLCAFRIFPSPLRLTLSHFVLLLPQGRLIHLLSALQMVALISAALSLRGDCSLALLPSDTFSTC